MKSLWVVSLSLVSLGLLGQSAQAEDALSKIGRAAQQTSQTVQEVKDTRDVLTGQKTPEVPVKPDAKSADPRKMAHDQAQHRMDEVKGAAAANGRELERHGQEMSDEKHRRNAERKAMKDHKKGRNKKHDHGHDHKVKDKRD